jgi:hypothetical protein
VSSTFNWPSGSEDFEGVAVGDPLSGLSNWVFVDGGSTAGVYTVRCAADVYNGGGISPGTSLRWLRINDANSVDQNRFYSPTVTAPSDPSSYTFTWYVNVEAPILSAANFPRMVIQHNDGGMQNAWGIEFSNTAINLVVIAPTGASTNSTTPLDIALFNQWVKLDLIVNFTNNTVAASVNNQVPISAAISPSVTMDKKEFRFCYRGEGAGNVCRVLLDDLSFSGSTGGPPTISVTRNSVPLTTAQIISVQTGTTLAALNLAIAVNDPQSNNTSLSASISDLTTQGILVSEFNSASAAVPYTLTPTTGVFNVAGATHVITLIANDGQGNQTTFGFTIAVGSGGGGGGGNSDDGGCASGEPRGPWLLAGVAAALGCALRVRRRRV